MKENTKNIIVIILFALSIGGMLIVNVFKEDTLISVSERRKLEQFPEFSLSKLLDGTFFNKFDKYVTDQFVERETFRKAKVLAEKDIFKKLDYNNIYEKDGLLIEQLYPINEKSITNLLGKINSIKDTYITENNNVYFTIVPDKNYFVSGENLRIDYDQMVNLMKDGLSYAKYIDIFDELELSDYYITDSHWRQEKIVDVAKKILNEVGITSKAEYEEKEIVEFKGVYAGQYPISNASDKITILTNEMLDNCTVYNYETNKETKIYDMEKTTAYDKYDIYLSGATSLLKIENPNSQTDKELIIFRDSYGSSLTPLLVEGYKTITVVDTRYISPKILNNYIEFTNQDIIFEYSTTLINDSITIK